MKRSRFVSLFTALAVYCIMALSWVFEPVAAIAVSAARAVKKLVLDGFKLAATAGPGDEPLLPLIKARAFVLRIIKRERPIISSAWRMCPST